jgi:hypothetical protein
LELEFEYRGGGLPHEILTFEYAHNDEAEDAYKNFLLAAAEPEKHDLILGFAESVFLEKGWTYCKIENSEPIQLQFRQANPDLDLPVLSYTALEPSHETANNPEITNRLVNVEGKSYVMKEAPFPGHGLELFPELGAYEFLAGSPATPQFGGSVERKGRQDVFLILYPKGGFTTTFRARMCVIVHVVVDNDHNITVELYIWDLQRLRKVGLISTISSKIPDRPKGWTSQFPPHPLLFSDYRRHLPCWLSGEPTAPEKRNFKVHGFGKTVWEAYE